MSTFRVVTWNVSYEFIALPTTDPWDTRVVAAQHAVADADVLAVQEVSKRQVHDLARDGREAVYIETPMPDAMVQAARRRFGDDTEAALVEVAILYRRERFELLRTDHRWLSPTPDVPLSVGFGNVVPRQLLWVVLQERATGRIGVVATTHVDHRCTSAMVDVLSTQLDGPVAEHGRGILLGDLNTHTAPDALGALTATGWRDSHPTGSLSEDPTYLGPMDGPGRIDHILFRGGVDVVGWTRVDRSRSLSDHLAVSGAAAFL
jgi:endonuclease/exonuclease/phosphatase family metal-dependent hydrolase